MSWSWLPSVAYPPPGYGYWMPVTSTLNWCEEDYYATIYSAEIINTLTNFLFVLLAFKGLINCYQNGHDRVFMVTYGGYMTVGIGSMLFHSSLKYPMQLVDELSMIYTACFSCYASFSYRRSRLYAFCVAMFLISLSVFITGYYHYLGDPVFHQRMFAILISTVLLRSICVMELNVRPSLKKRKRLYLEGQQDGKITEAEKEEQQRQDKRDMKILKTMWAMIAYGLSIFVGGFGVWTLDNKFCSTLRLWRREIGLPWGIFLEGHAWWHIMTGLGAYFYIMWGVWLRHCLNGRQDEYELYWPHLVFSLPAVVKVQKSAKRSTPIQNGGLKKDL